MQNLHKRIVQNPPTFSTHHQFTIYDPKERTISVVPFCDRVIHHAIINVLEPIFEKQFIYHTYACRKNKGTHKAALYAQKKAKSCKWYLKLDVRKYFDSINHEVLENQLQRIIIDKKVLTLLFSIIDSYGMLDIGEHNRKIGLPIGNLTSQFFANLYLSLKSPVFRKTKDGVTFLGWTIFKNYIKPSAKTSKRMKRIIKNIVKECGDDEQTAL